MPRINLLPVKAARRRDSAKNEMLAVASVIFATLVGLYIWYSGTQSSIEELEAKLQRVKSEISRLESDVGKVKEFKAKEAKIQDKLKAITTLMSNKVGPAKMLDVLSTIMTDESKRVWLTSLEAGGGKLKLEGAALEHEDISEFQIALERRAIFEKVQLLRVNSASSGKLRILNWVIVCNTNFAAG